MPAPKMGKTAGALPEASAPKPEKPPPPRALPCVCVIFVPVFISSVLLMLARVGSLGPPAPPFGVGLEAVVR
ncbi:hypothetical protein P4O66_017195 [Electrophorus voltai]|uniref:Uncharacterized protein n=1 Tax=Electrophorus voltai TaxID=2609070 RepID=A0AAD8YUP8_9TELE|nr:hypothetical protein P4O66_017195 [Electrophorus voltai]